MNSSPLASTMFRQRAQPFSPSRSKGWTMRNALLVTMVTVLLTWVMYHEAFPPKESSSQVQGDRPNSVPRKVMKDAEVSLDTKQKDIDTEELTDLPTKSDTGKHSAEEDSTKDETPSADSLTNNVKEPSTEEGETTAGEKIEDEVPHESNDTSVQRDLGTEFAEVQNEQARVEQEESVEDVKATKASEEVDKSESKNPDNNQENGDHLDADDRLASGVDENEREDEKKEESSKEKLEDDSMKTLDAWSESIKESMEESSPEDKLEEEEFTKTMQEHDDQSGEVTVPAESSQGNTGFTKTEHENEKQTEILANDNAETSFSSEVQHEKVEEQPIEDASSEVEQGGSSDEKMEEKPEDQSDKQEQVEDGKYDMQSEKFDSESHKADSKDGQSAGETDLHEYLSHEVTEARPDDAEKLKGDEGEAWKDEEGERKAETRDETQESVESQLESTQEAKSEDEIIVKPQEAVIETGSSGNIDDHDSEEKVEGDVEEHKNEVKVENSEQNLEVSSTYNTAKQEGEDSKAEPA